MFGEAHAIPFERVIVEKLSHPLNFKEYFMESTLECIEPNAAGIDIGSFSHFVAVPQERDSEVVREFGGFTEDLHLMSEWLKKCGIKTVAMEATGVYWIPVYEVLLEQGFDVCLVNARYYKNVSGRKSDVLDCQWLQQLHSYGLLKPSFQPGEEEGKLRQLVRHRANLVRWGATHAQQMQKALAQMNLQLTNVVSDILGDTGMKIIRAICHGERDPKKLAILRDTRCKNSVETIEKSLHGYYRAEIVFSLKQALSSYDHYQQQIAECNGEIEKLTDYFDDKSDGQKVIKKREAKRNNIGFDAQERLTRILGVNLTEIPGINALTALTVIAEIGLSVDKWKNSKAFASWLGLCPGTKISGGKRLGGKTKACKNRASEALRIAASALYRSQTSLGSFLRRMKARLGPAKAITAAAHKLAVIIYTMIKEKKSYDELGAGYYDQLHKERAVKNLEKFARRLGFEITPKKIEQASMTACST
jgi:transposase